MECTRNKKAGGSDRWVGEMIEWGGRGRGGGCAKSRIDLIGWMLFCN